MGRCKCFAIRQLPSLEAWTSSFDGDAGKILWRFTGIVPGPIQDDKLLVGVKNHQSIASSIEHRNQPREIAWHLAAERHQLVRYRMSEFQ